MKRLELQIKELAVKKGFENAQQLQIQVPLTYNQVKRLWDNDNRSVSLDALDAIAKCLDVPPCELLVYKEDTKTQSTETPVER